MLLVLTLREWDVLRELCRDGADNRLIGRRLFVTEDTVKTHVKNILRKARMNTRTQLAVAVLRWELWLAVSIPPRAK
jgi:DNA-binding NarL/FixJ family response regulator